MSVLTDVNGGGRADLVAINPIATPSVLEQQHGAGGVFLWTVAYGRGDGTFEAFYRPVNRQVNYDLASTQLRRWRAMPADVNGDGYGDIIMIDAGVGRIHTLPAAGGFNLAQVQSNSWASGGCVERFGYGYFDGVFTADIDGNARSDLLSIFHGPPGWMRHVRIFGYDNGLSNNAGARGVRGATEVCQQVTPDPAWPYQNVRMGDLNGDGIKDMLLSYQGRGRDLRYWLGTSSPAAANPVRFWSQDSFSYPHAQEADGHLNNWEFLVGDVTGDGIDDNVQYFWVQQGYFINQGINTPTALGDLTAVTSDSAAQPDGGSANDYSYVKHHAVLGDFNGDGKLDLAWGSYGNTGGSGNLVFFRLGTPTGLSASYTGTTNTSAEVDGDSRALSLRAADINGDGKDDILYINDNINRSSSAKIAYAAGRATSRLWPACKTTRTCYIT